MITRADELLVDFEDEELSRFRDAPELDPGVLRAGAEGWWIMEPDAPPTLAEEAFKLNGNYTHEFGHWIQEYLPRLGIALLAGLQPMPLLVDQNMPASHRDALALFCPGWPLLELPHLRAGTVGRLWCASHPVFRGWYPDDWEAAWEGQVTDPENFARAIAALKARIEPVLAPPTGVDRVFLGRRPRRKKRMHNHDEIATLAQQRGYQLVYPEDLPFVEQLRLVHHARRIVAPDGSNSLLSQFASPGSRTCILNNPHTYPLAELDGLFAAVGNELSVLTGPLAVPEPSADPYWDEYRIDEVGFSRFLDEWS